MKWQPKVTRDATLFLSGLVGIAYETLAKAGERPTLLLLFAAMVGLPAFLRGDEKRKGEDDGVSSSEGGASP